ncbi:MAG: transcriptional repressor LexA [Clostridia bacterium]|nr:transcriptional repressor LexA [Clostridia bacterium]
MLGTREEIESRIMEFVKSYVSKHHMTPRYTEIAKALGFKSVSSVFTYVKDLESKGLLVVNGMRGANLANCDELQPAAIPLVSAKAGGTQIGAEENVETYLYMDRMLLGEGDFFALRAKGDSMAAEGIEDGDIVVCRRQKTAKEGGIFAAVIDNEVTLRRLRADDGLERKILNPVEDSFPHMGSDRIQILGRAVKIIKDVK